MTFNRSKTKHLPESRLSHFNSKIVLALLVGLAAVLLIARPSEVPPLFHDEGWNLTVARNWIESGHYGALLDGKPVAPSMISTGFPAIIPIALSFRAFGIGILQGRLPGILFTAGALALIFYIAASLYNREVAIGALAVLLLMPMHPELHPIIVGRQAMGEMPALFYLLCGYACFLASLQGRRWLSVLSVLFWGLALMTKAQVIPFLLAALIVPLFVALVERSWEAIRLTSSGLLGTLLVFGGLIWLQKYLLNDPMPTQTHIGSWSATTALVPVASVRLSVLKVTLILGIPAILALAAAARKAMRRYKEGYLATEIELVRLSLLVISGSWLAWYVLLSIGWLRYLFPATLIASIFLSSLLYELTDGFKFGQILKNASAVFLALRFIRQTLTALLVTMGVAWAVLLTIYGLHQSYASDAGKAPAQVADFINMNTPSSALIECGEAELYFLLDRRYHYSSTDIGMRLVRRRFWGVREKIDYGMLDADANYWVVGPMARMLRLFDHALTGNEFTLLKTIAPYDIYQRQPGK